MKKLILICLIYSFGQTVNAQTVKDPVEKIAADVVKLNVFIKQTSNKTGVFVGETFFCDYSLIISSELVLTDMKLKKLPAFVPFKSQEDRIETLKFIDTLELKNIFASDFRLKKIHFIRNRLFNC